MLLSRRRTRRSLCFRRKCVFCVCLSCNVHFPAIRGDTEAVCLQVSLLKKRLQASGAVHSSDVETSPSTDTVDANTDIQSPSKDDGSTLNTGVCAGVQVHRTSFYTKVIFNLFVWPAEGSGEPGSAVDLEELQKRIKRQESLLQRCKEMIRSSKERTAQLTSENEVLQQQLQERLQELEKMKVQEH